MPVRVTMGLLAATLVVAVAGVWWVNRQTELAAHDGAAGLAVAQTADVQEPQVLPSVTVREQAPTQDQPSTQLNPEQRRNRANQAFADQARVDLNVGGCFDWGKSCKCVDKDGKAIAVEADACKLMASEPPIMAR